MQQKQSDFATLLYRAASLWRLRMDAHMRLWDMNMSSWEILWLLYRGDTRYNQYMLASRLGIETSRLVRLLDRMEKRDLLRRQPDPQDRRQNHIVITPSGFSLFEEISAGVTALREAILTEVDETDLEQGVHILERVLDNLLRILDDERRDRKIPQSAAGARPSRMSFPGQMPPGIVERRKNDRRAVGNTDRRQDPVSASNYPSHLERRKNGDRRSNTDRRKNDRRRTSPR
ncbi:MAG: MarR family transcriptional regulator [Zoogloeaceae bacterium]|jgi:DNA-binding MarR family transcriptional regulator|nr:MarR family transcriptional regulator [Zoogloeaceae bacterium]